MLSTSTEKPVRSIRLDLHTKVKLAFMAAAFVALCLSVGLWFTGSKEEGLFVGLWVPAIHSLGTLVLTGERVPSRGGAGR